MARIDGRSPSIGFFYFVASALGLSFSGTLVWLAWDNVVEAENRAFAFEARSIDETVGTRARAANDDLHALVNLVQAVAPAERPVALRRFAARLVDQHSFVTEVAWYRALAGKLTRAAAYAPAAGARLPAVMTFPADSAPALELQATAGFDAAIPLSLPDVAASGSYVLVQRVGASAASPGRGVAAAPTGALDAAGGVVALVIEPTRLLGDLNVDSATTLALHLETEGIGGRRLLFRRSGAPAAGARVLSTLESSTQVRFEHYSARLTMTRPLVWRDLDKPMILIAAILGLGVTLLLVALARAKDLQARELAARNRVIEEQVARQTRELAVARDQALEASRVKSDFLASMSHEIRTPLNAIIGMAELLAETPLSGEQQRYVGVFRNAGEALLSLVNDILDFSKIEAGQLVLEHIAFPLRELVEQAAEIHAHKAAAKDLELTVMVDEALPPLVMGDPSRLRQIVLNLIGNALKFTERGGIDVRVTEAAGGAGSRQLRFRVADTGIGIPADKTEAIFTSFTQVDSSTTRKYGGTGLGLTISRKLVEMMGGRIWVESEEGVGSAFHFELPLTVAEESARPAAAASDLAGMAVLIVDDNATNRLILEAALRATGAAVTPASDGTKALTAWERQAAQGRAFDLVLCDAQMPGLDGFAVIEAIKARGGMASTVLMLSSSNLANELERAQALGVGAHLVKPVKRAELLNAIAASRAAGTAAAQAPVPAGAPADSGSARRARILLVEDNADNRLLVRTYLKQEPLQIDEAENGAAALAMATSERYDLILMDIQMPVMDGHEATRAIRAQELATGRAPVPIIALTAHAVREDMERSLVAGCTAHLTKPIKKKTLLEALAEHLA